MFFFRKKSVFRSSAFVDPHKETASNTSTCGCSERQAENKHGKAKLRESDKNLSPLHMQTHGQSDFSCYSSHSWCFDEFSSSFSFCRVTVGHVSV